MMKKNAVMPFFLIICCLFFLSGCEETSSPSTDATRSFYGKMFLPSADGEKVIGSAPVTIDISNCSQGYALVSYTGESDKISLQLDCPDGSNYRYFIAENGIDIPITFTRGDGTYIISAYEHIGDDQYVSLFTEMVDIQLDDEFLPFLYPNQYVNFSGDSKAVAKASRMAAESATDLDLLSTVYHYVVNHVTYDEEKAATVELGYLPDIDETLDTGKGICFDYAALMTAMLRSQGVPCKMAIGYSSDIKHAWIDVYIEGQGWIDKAIEFNGSQWHLLDPTFASGNTEEAVKDYIGDGENYVLQYNH